MGPPRVEHVTISPFCSISLSGWHGTKLYFFSLNNFFKSCTYSADSHSIIYSIIWYPRAYTIPSILSRLSSLLLRTNYIFFFLELTNFPYPGQLAVLFHQLHSYAIFHKENRNKGEGTGFGIQMIETQKSVWGMECGC